MRGNSLRRVAFLAIMLIASRAAAQPAAGGAGQPGAAPPAPEMETEVTTYAPAAEPVQLPVGRTHSLETALEKKVRAALEQVTEVNFKATQLGDVAALLALRFQIDIQLDVEALAADGRGSETPITAQLRGVTLHDALERMLGGQGMTYLVKHNVLLITTKAAASQPENLTTKLYEVQDLVVMPNDAAIVAPQFEELIYALQQVRMRDWQDNGGTIGFVRQYEGPGILALVITHDEPGHRQIGALLEQLRQAKHADLLKLQATKPVSVSRTRIKPPAAAKSEAAPHEDLLADEPAAAPLPAPAASLPALSDSEKSFRAALDAPGEVHFLDTPLAEVAQHFSKALDRQVVLDHEALAADGKGGETPITKSIKHGTNRSLLRLILTGQGLTFLYKNDIVLITTQAAATQPENHVLRVYPVPDLVLTPQLGRASVPDFDSLIEILTSTARFDDWSDNGGTIGNIRSFLGPGNYSLVIGGSSGYHEDIERTLALLRSARVPEVFDAQARRRTQQPLSVKILSAGAFSGGGFF